MQKTNSSESAKSKTRLLALDGIRGFAALAVTISHVGFNVSALTSSPIVSNIFRVFSAGPTSVQLFFVLSGFLMAYLYPTVSDPLRFWQKRYLRIMPLFSVVVLGLGLTLTYLRGTPNSVMLLGMLGLGLLLHILWLLIAVVRTKIPIVPHLIFFAFVGLQIVWFGVSLTTAMGIGQQFIANLSEFQKDMFAVVSNLTMTMYWQKDLVVMEGVFWSLVPEMMFYVLYPIVADPLLLAGSKLKLKWNVLLVSAVILMLFQLDTASRALYSMHGIFISRATGFVIGMVLGTLYRTKNSWWQAASKFLQSKYLGVPLLLLFAVTMAWEWPDRYHQIRQFVMLHYLGLSILFGILVAAALQKGSVIERIFSNKALVFLGMVSYSLYLTHPFVISRLEWSSLMVYLMDNLTTAQFTVARGVIHTLGSVLFATALYYLVESLYFHKWPSGTASKIIEQISLYIQKMHAKRATLVLTTATVCLVIIAWYSTDTVPSVVLSRHDLGTTIPGQLLQVTGSQSQTLQFTAKHSHLSAVQFAMDYAYDPNVIRESPLEDLQLAFTLTDAEGNVIVQSLRHPQELAGEPQFPFGFPTQADSAGKSYTMHIALENADSTDEVMVYPQTGIVAQYTTDHLAMQFTTITYVLGTRLWFSLWRWEVFLSTVLVVSVAGVLFYASAPANTAAVNKKSARR